jgi:hypothetical protein
MLVKAAVPFESAAPQITLVAGARYPGDLPDLQCRLWTVRPSLRAALPQDFCVVSFAAAIACGEDSGCPACYVRVRVSTRGNARLVHYTKAPKPVV